MRESLRVRRSTYRCSASVLCSITTVADTLAKMPALKYVDLGFTELSGALDTACGLASTKQLQQLNVINNALSGSIPSCITSLPQMVELHLDSNQLTGTVPAFASSNSPLVYFSASDQVWYGGGAGPTSCNTSITQLTGQAS